MYGNTHQIFFNEQDIETDDAIIVQEMDLYNHIPFHEKKHVTVVGNGQNWMNLAYVIIAELNMNIYSPKMIRIAY